ncbi:MAG: helix-turn-helix transcriptional regulator [Syntrophobacteraceae bacterium]
MSDALYLGEEEVERITGRKVQTLRNDRFKGRGIPYVKMGRSVRYSRSDVLAFMEARKVKTQGI